MHKVAILLTKEQRKKTKVCCRIQFLLSKYQKLVACIVGLYGPQKWWVYMHLITKTIFLWGGCEQLVQFLDSCIHLLVLRHQINNGEHCETFLIEASFILQQKQIIITKKHLRSHLYSFVSIQIFQQTIHTHQKKNSFYLREKLE